jgi:hypothetical protein
VLDCESADRQSTAKNILVYNTLYIAMDFLSIHNKDLSGVTHEIYQPYTYVTFVLQGMYDTFVSIDRRQSAYCLAKEISY